MNKIDQILEKAFTSGDLANGGLLNPEQAAKLVQGIFDSAVVSVEARREPMKASKRQIDKMTFTGDILQKPVAVGTEHTNTTSPTTTKVTLDAKEVIIALDLGYDALEDSIEGASLQDSIIQMCASKLGFELDQLILNGDAPGGGGTKLDVLDGLFKQITTNTYDAIGQAVLNEVTLSAAYKKLPSQYSDLIDGYRFYVSHLARINYIDVLGAKAVNDAFSMYLVGGKEPQYMGIPVRKVGAIPTYVVTAANPPTIPVDILGSKALLIHPKNIVLGIHRDISWEFERKPRHRVVQITMTMKLDVKLEREDACVKITNIKHA